MRPWVRGWAFGQAEAVIKGMTETELERQLEFLLNQSEAFMGFMQEKIGDHAVTEAAVGTAAPVAANGTAAEDQENVSPPKRTQLLPPPVSAYCP